MTCRVCDATMIPASTTDLCAECEYDLEKETPVITEDVVTAPQFRDTPQEVEADRLLYIDATSGPQEDDLADVGVLEAGSPCRSIGCTQMVGPMWKFLISDYCQECEYQMTKAR